MSEEVLRFEEIEFESTTGVALVLDNEEEFDGIDVPEVLSVLPLKNTVLYPYAVTPLLVNTERSKSLVASVLKNEDGLMFSSAVRKEVDGSPCAEDLFKTGTVLRIIKWVKDQDGSYRMLVQGISRGRIIRNLKSDPFIVSKVERLVDAGDSESVEVIALARTVREEFASHALESTALPDDLQGLVMGIEDPSRLADLVAANLRLDLEKKQSILESLDVVQRLRVVEEELRHSREAEKLEGEIREQVQTDMGKTQREYILRQQLDQIRKELGEVEDGDADLERFRVKLQEADLPEKALKQAERELSRLEETPSASAEYGVIRTYLEWLIDLPWSKESRDELDLRQAALSLDQDHWGLDKVKERILEYIAVLSLKGNLKSPILCLSGPPGTGKTSLGRSIARSLNRRFCRISLGGMRDEAEIRGHRRTYIGAQPGRILQSLRRSGTRNPVFLLDEIDKVGADFRGDPSAALLEVLDPEQNASFSDHYMEIPFDLSQVLFIATANQVEPIPAALRDRMEVIQLSGYTEEEKVEISKKFLIPKQLDSNGVANVGLSFPDRTIQKLIGSYTREAGVRNLERQIGALCRKTALRIAEGNEVRNLDIVPGTVSDFLGPIKYEPELADRAGQRGVAVGLAYTSVGGEILFVESTKMPGKGNLKLTGSLGGVMKESAEAARSWLRSRAPELGLQSFDDEDLHLHVPAGAVPKDGPSAGVAMVASLASLLTGKSLPPDVAMTGEITLRGKVLPVGGIKEKLLAARRAGIRRVVLPEKNNSDVEEIAGKLLEGLSLDFVSTIDEVLDTTLVAKSA